MNAFGYIWGSFTRHVINKFSTLLPQLCIPHRGSSDLTCGLVDGSRLDPRAQEWVWASTLSSVSQMEPLPSHSLCPLKASWKGSQWLPASSDSALPPTSSPAYCSPCQGEHLTKRNGIRITVTAPNPAVGFSMLDIEILLTCLPFLHEWDSLKLAICTKISSKHQIWSQRQKTLTRYSSLELLSFVY